MAYHLKKYIPVKSNYEIYNKELLIIMRLFRGMGYGITERFEGIWYYHQL